MNTSGTMNYKLFGSSGLRVSELCLGTMNFGGHLPWGVDQPTSQAIFDAFVNKGGNYIDAADVYTNGQCEEYLADFIASDRDYYVLSSKYSLINNANSPNGFGNSRKHLIRSVESILGRLRTDYLDILWVHSWDFLTRPEEIIRSLNDLISSGKVNYIGLSNAPSWVLAKCNTLARQYGWNGFSGFQLEYSLAQRTIEAEFFPLLEEFDLSLSCWSPLGGGILSGKYRMPRDTTKSRFDTMGVDVSSAHKDLLSLCANLADSLKCSLPQLALAWCIKRNSRIIPIIGASSPEQMTSNLLCLQVELDATSMDTLNSSSRPSLHEPYGILSRSDQVKRQYGEFKSRIDNHRYYYPDEIWRGGHGKVLRN